MLWSRLVQTTLKAFKKTDFTSVREHEEFVWLHDRFVENEDYAGIIVSYLPSACTSAHKLHTCSVLEGSSLSPQIPPSPPRPDFDEPRHKLAKLREGRYTQDIGAVCRMCLDFKTKMVVFSTTRLYMEEMCLYCR